MPKLSEKGSTGKFQVMREILKNDAVQVKGILSPISILKLFSLALNRYWKAHKHILS